MAPSSLTTLALLAGLYILYRSLSSLLARRRFHAFAKQNGCEAPHDATGPFPYGWSGMRRMMNAKKTGEDILDDIIAADFGDRHTIKKTVISGEELIFTRDPANLQAMLATQFSDFETGPMRHATFHPVLGKSIFSSDGARWKHSRALLKPSFSRENVNNLATTAQAADSLIHAFGEQNVTGWTSGQDVLPLFFNFTIDTATEFLFGESIGALAAAERADDKSTSTSGAEKETLGSGAMAASSDFADAFQEVNAGLLMRIRLQRLYWLSDGLKFRRACGVVRRFAGGFVEKALADVEAEGKVVEKKQKYGLLESLATQTRDREDLISETLAVMMAGRDTTAGLLGWSVLRLALHPEVFQSLRAVCLRDFPSDAQPDFARLKSCRPLQHFLQEVLRLHSTVPVNNRVAVKDTTLPLGGGADQKSPIAVQAGQVVAFSVYLMHRRKDLWGEDALEFRPSRWEQKIPAWQWLPFLGGPRVCLGQQFALTEAGFVLVRLLREFDAIEAVNEGEMRKMKKGLGLTMWPADGVKVRFHKASRS